MRAVLTDGFTFELDKFKAVDTGIVLLEGDRREEASGFVPTHQLLYVLPDDIAERRGHSLSEEAEWSGGQQRQAGQQPQQMQTGQIPPQQTSQVPPQQTSQVPPQQPAQMLPQGSQVSQVPPQQAQAGRTPPQQTQSGQIPTQQSRQTQIAPQQAQPQPSQVGGTGTTGEQPDEQSSRQVPTEQPR